VRRRLLLGLAQESLPNPDVGLFPSSEQPAGDRPGRAVEAPPVMERKLAGTAVSVLADGSFSDSFGPSCSRDADALAECHFLFASANAEYFPNASPEVAVEAIPPSMIFCDRGRPLPGRPFGAQAEHSPALEHREFGGGDHRRNTLRHRRLWPA